jgi:hypothetical protein
MVQLSPVFGQNMQNLISPHSMLHLPVRGVLLGSPRTDHLP